MNSKVTLIAINYSPSVHFINKGIAFSYFPAEIWAGASILDPFMYRNNLIRVNSRTLVFTDCFKISLYNSFKKLSCTIIASSVEYIKYYLR